jgi:hypothetical protein
MDKCFSFSDKATSMLPCYHKVCDVCLNDLISLNWTSANELVCPCYPTDECDNQCLKKFTREEVLVLPTNGVSHINIENCCVIHNKEYTNICGCQRVYCDECVPCKAGWPCSASWKKRTLAQTLDAKNVFEVKKIR